MAKFYYRARDQKGDAIDGSIEAGNAWIARKTLTRLNLMVLQVSRFDFKIWSKEITYALEKLINKVTPEEQMVLMSQLETGISVGIPIVQIFEFLRQDVQNRFLKEALIQITQDVTDGSTLHEAFAKHPTIFNPTIIGLIKTGEVSGKLEETLGMITRMIEQQAENRAKVKSAIFYPKIVLFVLGATMVGLVYFIIPKLKSFLNNLGTDLPPITQFVMSASDFATSYWYLIIGGFVGARYLFRLYALSESGKLNLDRIKLRAPIFGQIFLFLELHNLCVVLDLLISSGVPLLEALEILKESQQNMVFKNALSNCQEHISSGGTLTQGMEGEWVFPSSFRNLLGIGEESGRMQPVLQRLARYYQIQIDYKLDNLSKLIEPILLALIFVMVLIVALAIMLPIWKMSAATRKSF